MRHASECDLSSIIPLLARLRSLSELREKKFGIFYRKSKAFLHFHEDHGKLYADVRLSGTEFQRFPSNTSKEQDQLYEAISEAIK